MEPGITVEQIQALIAAAVYARERAYCPYSHFAVGAAVLTHLGLIYSGCNVENSSYSVTVCAERNALAAAVLGGMRPGQLAAVALVAAPLEREHLARTFPAKGTSTLQAADPLPNGGWEPPSQHADGTSALQLVPCGACLQALAEFAAPGCIVISSRGPLEQHQAALNRLDELLPRAFRLRV